MPKEINCKNCETVFNGNFCPNCSQAATTNRINAHYILHDIVHSIFHVDKGLPYTFAKLCKNPGKALLEYLNGKRVLFFKPFAYVIILSTLSSIFIKIFPNKDYVETNNNILSVISHYPSLLVFALIPLVALISWLVFIKKSLNYWEHFIVHTYLAAQINIILVVMHLISISGIFSNINMAIKLTIFNFFFMTFHGFTFSSLFSHNYKDKFNFKFMLQIFFCCLLLGFIYAMALIYTRVALRWF